MTETGHHPSTYTIATTNNRLSSITGSLARSYSYDAAGNTQSDGTTTFTYNDAGRMVTATRSGLTTTYLYNALGQRTRKTTTTASTYFVYDEAGHLIGEYDTSGNLLQETIWLNDIPIAVLKPNASSGIDHFYVHTDHLNTPRKISRPTDNVILWRWDSDPFGTTAADEDPDGDTVLFAYHLRFPGQYFDQETGLHHNYFRDYDPQVGRYVESDPIGLEGGINTYAYVMNNPLTYVDSFGLKCGTGWSDRIVDDSPFGIDISDCCQAHDDCYADCFSSPPKSHCDEQFRMCLYRKCAGRIGISLWTCHLVAEGYPWGVDNRIGRRAFRDARRGDPKEGMYGGITIGTVMSRPR